MLKVVDAFHAMTSPRLYREPLAEEDALRELESGAGTEFDPALVGRLVGLVRSGDLESRSPARNRSFS